MYWKVTSRRHYYLFGKTEKNTTSRSVVHTPIISESSWLLLYFGSCSFSRPSSLVENSSAYVAYSSSSTDSRPSIDVTRKDRRRRASTVSPVNAVCILGVFVMMDHGGLACLLHKEYLLVPYLESIILFFYSSNKTPESSTTHTITSSSEHKPASCFCCLSLDLVGIPLVIYYTISDMAPLHSPSYTAQ